MDIQAILDKVQESVVTIETSGHDRRGRLRGGRHRDRPVRRRAGAHQRPRDRPAPTRSTSACSTAPSTTASLVGSLPDDDLAVIRVDGVDDLVPAELGSSDDLQVGEPVIAIGNALNLGGQPSVTQGIVSAKDRSIEAPGSPASVSLDNLIQTDAAINPGNSGGPLVDAAGQVVGINTAIIDDSQNIGFAIAIDLVKPLIEDLRNGGGEITPDTALLGRVSTVDLSGVEERRPRPARHPSPRTGAFVAEVTPGTRRRRGRHRGRRRDRRVRRRADRRRRPTSAGTVREHEPGDQVEHRASSATARSRPSPPPSAAGAADRAAGPISPLGWSAMSDVETPPPKPSRRGRHAQVVYLGPVAPHWEVRSDVR